MFFQCRLPDKHLGELRNLRKSPDERSLQAATGTLSHGRPQGDFQTLLRIPTDADEEAGFCIHQLPSYSGLIALRHRFPGPKLWSKVPFGWKASSGGTAGSYWEPWRLLVATPTHLMDWRIMAQNRQHLSVAGAIFVSSHLSEGLERLGWMNARINMP